MPGWGPGGGGNNPGSATLTATFRSGNNATNGPWELYLEDSFGDSSGGQYAWGTSNGQLESGQVDVQFNAEAGGGSNSVSFGVAGAPALAISPASYGNITSVGFYVSTNGIQSSETTEWLELTVTFYDANGNPNQLDVNSDQLPATSSSGGGASSSYWIATPDSGFTAVSVEIEGVIHLNASVATPGSTALLGDIFVWTS